MEKLFIIVAMTVLISSCNSSRYNYPETKKVDTIDHYFGTDVPDPYRWLEDDNAPEVKEWVEAQNEVTFSYLNQIPFREKVEERLKEIWNYPKVGVPFEKGGYFFISKNDGLQNQNVLYYMESLGAEEKVLLDPNTFSEDGTVALAGYDISNDGKYIVYATSTGGSDWRDVYVKEIATGKLLEDHVQWVKFSNLAWHNEGFYYSRYNKPEEGDELTNKNSFQKVYYHKLGTSQDEDKLIFENTSDPSKMYIADVSDDQRYLFIYESQWSTNGNAIHVTDLDKGEDEIIKLAEGYDFRNGVVGTRESTIFLLTNEDAPRKRLFKIDMNNPGRANWVEILPEKEEVLEDVYLLNGNIVAKYMKDVHHILEIYDTDGNYIREIELPTLGSVGSFRAGFEKQSAFYSFESYTYPTTIYEYDATENASSVYHASEVDFNPENYETNQVFIESKDGTRVPLFIVHKKGLELNGENPTILFGYGGFNVVYEPNFSTSRIIWLENGGVYVNAHIRGGGEYGEEWHLAGTKLNKQNVFDDFIATAEYLVNEKYTNPEKLGVIGGSNGGLLVGAVINQRPDLFGVAIPQVGVMDMLRFHNFTIGSAWVPDYGSSEDTVQFEYLYKYSPLHNISANAEYPAVLVTTADHDDRVVPAHSFKYIATLQEKYTGKNPVMIRIQTKAGHGAGKPTSIIIEELADIYSFMFFNMDIEPLY